MFRQRSSRVLLGALCLVVALSACRFSGFGNVPIQKPRRPRPHLAEDPAADRRRLRGRPRSPGSRPPTPSLAIASQAQTTYLWNATTARNAVLATVKNGHTPLHALDDFAASGIDAGQAAKLIVLSPSRSASRARRSILTATARRTSSPPSTPGCNRTAPTACSAARCTPRSRRRRSAAPVPASTLVIHPRRAAGQRRAGASPASRAASDLDIDTTAARDPGARRRGGPATDTDLNQGLVFLAARSSAQTARGSRSVPTTRTRRRRRSLAITAAGFDVNVPCWRNTVAPALAGHPYGNPLELAPVSAVADGRIVSQNDPFGINTFATSQSVQALERNWLPVAPLAPGVLTHRTRGRR